MHRDRELAFESSVVLYRNASPGDVGVAVKLFPKDPDVLQGSYPYESAVQELKLLCKYCCPQKKLDCIGEICWHSKLSSSKEVINWSNHSFIALFYRENNWIPFSWTILSKHWIWLKPFFFFFLVFHTSVRALRLICACAEHYRLLQENDPSPKTAAM